MENNQDRHNCVLAVSVKMCVVSLRVAILTVLPLLVLYNSNSYRFECILWKSPKEGFVWNMGYVSNTGYTGWSI